MLFSETFGCCTSNTIVSLNWPVTYSMSLASHTTSTPSSSCGPEPCCNHCSVPVADQEAMNTSKPTSSVHGSHALYKVSVSKIAAPLNLPVTITPPDELATIPPGVSVWSALPAVRTHCTWPSARSSFATKRSVLPPCAVKVVPKRSAVPVKSPVIASPSGARASFSPTSSAPPPASTAQSMFPSASNLATMMSRPPVDVNVLPPIPSR